ncbi:MAG TPA: M48 family metalloprotease, partial [Nitrososphaerales archaeon]|nr:M48 family metalloprotease [Nitrososphaerales archaeon]
TELEAVIGHEVGHVVHKDVLTSSVAATIAGVISYIGNIALYSMMFGSFGGGGNNRQGGNPIALIAAVILVPLGATFVQLGISRGLEYNADEFGAKLNQNPGALASALQKISAKVQTRPIAAAGSPAGGPSPATASLWIVNPFRGSTMLELFSTHPSIPHRIERLRKLGQQMGVYVQ